MPIESASQHQILIKWLDLMILAVGCMVVIGGITRLTESGLSMTDWRLIGGSIPPLNESDWARKFALYQGTPQHRIINPEMTLNEFKGIFWWEYIHRMWGRFLGVLFSIPFFLFLAFKWLDRRRILMLATAGLLGLGQGLFGWFMVQSGLQERPWVSPVRLTSHLLLALLLLGLLTWNRLELTNPQGSRYGLKPLPNWLSVAIPVLIGLFGIQITFGGFMAGLRSALDFPSFPTMNGQWFPSPFWKEGMGWHNLVENSAFVHFIHRGLGTVLLLLTTWVTWKGFREVESRWMKQVFLGLLAVVWIQFSLGALTVLNSLGNIPLVFGVLHQAGAIFLTVLLTICLFVRHQTAKENCS